MVINKKGSKQREKIRAKAYIQRSERKIICSSLRLGVWLHMIASMWVFIEFVYFCRLTRHWNIWVRTSKQQHVRKNFTKGCDLSRHFRMAKYIFLSFILFQAHLKFVENDSMACDGSYINMPDQWMWPMNSITPHLNHRREMLAILMHIYFVYWFYGQSY